MYDSLGIYGNDSRRSYTYIIKNVYPDPSEVFDTILDDENVMQRASSVTEAYDDFISDIISMTLVVCGVLHEKVTLQAQLNVRKLKDDCTEQLQTLIFLKAFASMSVSLALWLVVFNMEGSAKILSLIADESQHLVITQNILKKWAAGDDPEMKEIAKEEKGYVTEMLRRLLTKRKHGQNICSKKVA